MPTSTETSPAVTPLGGPGTADLVATDHPDGSPGLARLDVAGGVATSSTLRRVWTIAGERRHHLIDPATGRPAVTDLVSISVVAATAWEAEVLAKAGIRRATRAGALAGSPAYIGSRTV